MGLKAFSDMFSRGSRSFIAGKGEKEADQQMAEPVVSKINMQPAGSVSEMGGEPLQPFADRKPRQAYVAREQMEMERRQAAQPQQMQQMPQMQQMNQMQQPPHPMQQMPPQQNARPFAAPRQQAPAAQQPPQQQMPGAQQGAYQTAPVQQGGMQYPPQSAGARVPTLWQGPDGKLYSHVEYVFSLLNYSECNKVIDYMMANVTVLLSMESIANDIERQRCLDVIRGAAYVLGCAINRISTRGIYLISSSMVFLYSVPGLPDRAKTPHSMGFVPTQVQQGPARPVPMEPGGQQLPSGYTMQHFQPQGQPRQNPAMPQQWQNPTMPKPPMPHPGPMQQPMAQPGAMPPREAMQPVNQQVPMESEPAFNTVSPTSRFKMSGTQRNQPISISAATQGRSRPQ